MTRIRETFKLLRETTERKAFFEINFDGFYLKTRLIVTPHFSYTDNFNCHVCVSVLAWQALEKDFPKDVKMLLDIVKFDPEVGVTVVKIKGSDYPIRPHLSVVEWNVLMAYYFDPIMTVPNVLEQEMQDGHLVYNGARAFSEHRRSVVLAQR